jgi:hypothetical protein
MKREEIQVVLPWQPYFVGSGGTGIFRPCDGKGDPNGIHRL